jgi:hypothetical protein
MVVFVSKRNPGAAATRDLWWKGQKGRRGVDYTTGYLFSSKLPWLLRKPKYRKNRADKNRPTIGVRLPPASRHGSC